ncbi:NAD-binding protein [Cupriavidus sp. CV2]|uniref:NAD-binding protein n=1 Tax=Cupriavidus ulmosensis TaxID=3065913 RepID=UPI00296B57FF|nr:NAD-binding protein [Cupriavidus sp. CV2]MDW3682814.1 NAD-binding protein [Cupriavidus sp. CV2]
MMEASPSQQQKSSENAVGFIGLGAMGGPMVRRLLEQGFTVFVHDLNVEALHAAVHAGAIACDGAMDVSTRTELVFTCLPSLRALESVLFGNQGVAHGTAVRVVVDLSTTGPEFARAAARRFEESGISLIDAPITGNVVTAGNGKLGIMCSGPADAFRRAESAMLPLAGSMLLYLGEMTGRAQTLKLLNNLVSASGMAATCEAFVLGVKAGLDPEAMLDIINSGASSTNASRNKFRRAVLGRTFDYGARMAITAKDISLAVEEAANFGVPTWVSRSVQQLWRYAVAQGGAERDGTALITYLEPWAGVTVEKSTSKATLPTSPTPEGHQTDFTNVVVVCCPANLPMWIAKLNAAEWTVEVVEGREKVRTASESGGCLAERSCVILVVPDDDVPEVLPSWLAGRSEKWCVLDTCSLPRNVGLDLCRQLERDGHAYLDAPMVPAHASAAQEGWRAVVSGNGVAAAQVAPILEAVASKVFHLSHRAGDAQLMVAIDEALSASLLAVGCESYVTGAKAGLEPLTMAKILGIETGRTTASAIIIPEQVATRKFVYGKSLADAHRMLRLVCNEASSQGVTTWVFEATRLLFGLATALDTHGDDVSALIRYYEGWASVEVRQGLPDEKNVPAQAGKKI